jgi:hypothetical protein
VVGRRAGVRLSGESEVVHPGDAEPGVANAAAFESAVPEDLPGLVVVDPIAVDGVIHGTEVDEYGRLLTYLDDD